MKIVVYLSYTKQQYYVKLIKHLYDLTPTHSRVDDFLGSMCNFILLNICLHHWYIISLHL